NGERVSESPGEVTALPRGDPPEEPPDVGPPRRSVEAAGPGLTGYLPGRRRGVVDRAVQRWRPAHVVGQVALTAGVVGVVDLQQVHREVVEGGAGLVECGAVPALDQFGGLDVRGRGE